MQETTDKSLLADTYEQATIRIQETKKALDEAILNCKKTVKSFGFIKKPLYLCGVIGKEFILLKEMDYSG